MRILIIEDEPTLLDLLAETVRSEGYAVDVAADGENGLYLGSEFPIDVAIVVSASRSLTSGSRSSFGNAAGYSASIAPRSAVMPLRTLSFSVILLTDQTLSLQRTVMVCVLALIYLRRVTAI